MLRKRERFERTDVPRDNPHRNLIAVIVLVVVAVAVGLITSYAWRRAQADSVLGDRKLSAAIEAQTDVEGYQTDGYTASNDSFVNFLIVTVDDINADNKNLQKLEILSLNITQNTGHLVDVPVDINLITNGSSTSYATAKDRFDQAGLTNLSSALAKNAGLKFDHAVLANPNFWTELEALKAEGRSELINNAGALLKSIRSDLDINGLLDFSKEARKIGISNLSRLDMPTYEDKDAGGNAIKLIDGVSLAVQLGLVVEAS